MSGGSLEYLYYKVENAADEIRRHSGGDPLRIAFADHLMKVAEALHDIEWVYSGDYGKGEDEEAIRAVLEPGAELEAARDIAVEARDSLNAALDRAGG